MNKILRFAESRGSNQFSIHCITVKYPTCIQTKLQSSYVHLICIPCFYSGKIYQCCKIGAWLFLWLGRGLWAGARAVLCKNKCISYFMHLSLFLLRMSTFHTNYLSRWSLVPGRHGVSGRYSFYLHLHHSHMSDLVTYVQEVGSWSLAITTVTYQSQGSPWTLMCGRWILEYGPITGQFT